MVWNRSNMRKGGNNSLSFLAASLDRIEIKCRSTAGTMISVEDKEGVLNEMKNRGIA